MNPADLLMAPMTGTEHREVGGVKLDFMRAGAARIKRVVYPADFRWSRNMKPIVGTELCQHAHVGFLAQGQLHIQYADGAAETFTAPQVVVITPGHDGWVLGNEPAVMIEFDFEGETMQRLGLTNLH